MFVSDTALALLVIVLTRCALCRYTYILAQKCLFVNTVMVFVEKTAPTIRAVMHARL